jgi:predicted enzyme related to lactoylglutathione lyase
MTTASTPITNAAAPAVQKGRFVWYDLMTTDVAAATQFYTKVAGWGTQDFDMGPAGTYQMWTVDGASIGGVMPVERAGPGVPPHWMASVAVPSVDETMELAASLGGKVLVPPMEIPSAGRYAVIADPQGATIALFTPEGTWALGPWAPQHGQFSWHELLTDDHNAAFAFYAKLFDWQKVSDFDMGPAGLYLIYGQTAPGAPADQAPLQYGGMFSRTPDMPMPPSWCYYISVPSADETAERVKSLGGQVINGPMEVPGGDRIAQCVDPQGAVFAVHSRPAP